MGFARKNLGIDITGGGVEDANREAALIQTRKGDEAIDAVRGDLDPFRSVGSEAAQSLMQSVFNPAPVSAQEVIDDPFFQMMSQEQDRRLLQQKAALGLAGSGGTQDSLNRNQLLLGEQFRVNRTNERLQENQLRFNQLFNIAGLGANAAAQTGTQTANLLTDIGSAQSTTPLVAGQVGVQQGQQLMNLLGMGDYGPNPAPTTSQGQGQSQNPLSGMMQFVPTIMSAMSDKRLKENIIKVGEDEFGGIYRYNYIHDLMKEVYEGRIAQELMKYRPDAVFEGLSGYLQVSAEFAPKLVSEEEYA